MIEALGMVIAMRAFASRAGMVAAALLATVLLGWCARPALAQQAAGDGFTRANGLSNAAVSVKSSGRGQLASWHCQSTNAAVTYVQFFDVATAGAVVLGTTVPKWSLALAPTSQFGMSGLSGTFFAGLQVAATTTATGAVAPASAIDCNFTVR
jgi:hypothetical protein